VVQSAELLAGWLTSQSPTLEIGEADLVSAS